MRRDGKIPISPENSDKIAEAVKALRDQASDVANDRSKPPERSVAAARRRLFGVRRGDDQAVRRRTPRRPPGRACQRGQLRFTRSEAALALLRSLTERTSALTLGLQLFYSPASARGLSRSNYLYYLPTFHLFFQIAKHTERGCDRSPRQRSGDDNQPKWRTWRKQPFKPLA
jgi:hypothetical protein